MENYFKILNDINVSEKTEKKNGLTYLSWAWAWGEVKKLHPDATYTIYERETQYGPVNYFTDGRTCWVKTGVTVNGIEHIEDLPVLDFRNISIPLDKVTSYDVNKAIQRSLTKACARHGLGLYIYAGEDLPEGDAYKDPPEEKTPKTAKKQPAETYTCRDCGKTLESVNKKDGGVMTPVDIRNFSYQRYKRCLCPDCMKKADEEAKTA